MDKFFMCAHADCLEINLSAMVHIREPWMRKKAQFMSTTKMEE